MNISALQILLGFYVGTVLISLIVTLIQYYTDRQKIQKLVLLYWMGILVSSIANLFAAKLDPLLIVIISTTGTFLGQLVLAMCLAEIREMRFKILNLLFFYLFCGALTVILYFNHTSFPVYATPMAVGGVSPVFYIVYSALRRKVKPFSVVQKMFIAVSIAMNFHYLDWPLVRGQAEYLFIGMVIAFAILYMQSILMPMMVNEKVLQDRNDRLEEEVQYRAAQFTETQKQLWDANKLASIGRMAGGVAHEINNPLTIINMYADTMQEEAQSGKMSVSEVAEKSAKIQEAVTRIAHVTDGLRKVAKDHRSMERTENDLGQIVNETLSFCKDRLRVLDISFRAEVPSQPLPLLCNSGEISQVILNLLNNAIDALANRSDKWIVLSVSMKNGFYELSVQDSGHIDPSIVPKIMDPFFSSKPRGQGMGLGLSIGRAIAENHGGRMYLDTQSTSTRFVLELPRLGNLT
ncbi:ATP-binding protein [Bdellovibrio sp.]|uniref:ATP-binding protein n=1 Tax=Bdellovibrio sp. TaxID=28201 RepID=UPI0039E49B0B